MIGKAKNGEIVVYSEGFGDVLLKDDDKAIGWLNTAIENGNEFPTVLAKLGELLLIVPEKRHYFIIPTQNERWQKQGFLEHLLLPSSIY